jgi:hypothetical protein
MLPNFPLLKIQFCTEFSDIKKMKKGAVVSYILNNLPKDGQTDLCFKNHCTLQKKIKKIKKNAPTPEPDLLDVFLRHPRSV